MYVANPGNSENDVSLFTIATTGVITEVTPRTPVGTAPTKVLMDSAGSYLYVENSLSNNVSVFSIDSSTGNLTPVPNSPFPLGIIPQDMVLSPSGNFLYVAGVGEVLAGYSVKSGVLALVEGPVSTETSVNELAIDPSGTYLYAANTLDNSISIFSTNSGTLTQLAGSPLADPSGPTSLLFDPTFNFFYVANQGSGNIAGYTISSTGFPTALTTATFSATAPAFLAADPSGKYLLVGNHSSGIQVFGVDQTTGFLTSFETYSLGGNTTSIVVIPQPQ
jgi:6-phosphogluconolactonase (cycloisomerase 2 family)